MKEHIKRHLISAGITFVATFFLVLGLSLSQETFVFTKSALISVIGAALTAAIRAVAKIIYEVARDILKTK